MACRRVLLAAAVVAAVVAGVRVDGGRRRRLSNPQVHAFYYLWYGNPDVDGGWRHWNHSVLPHWRQEVQARYPADASFLPPHDIHAPFYPARGLYSSANASLVAEHFRDMRSHGIGVAVVSWWGRPGVSAGDSQGVTTDAALDAVFSAAQAAGMMVALHMEPYAGRDVATFSDDVRHVTARYRDHTSWYKLPPRLQRGGRGGAGEPLPVFFVYDSYHIAPAAWARALTPTGDASLRGTPADGVFVGLWLEEGHGADLLAAGFDGGYTYFASAGASYGASPQNWASMVAYSKQHGAFFAPSVGPGYDDTKIRPWNGATRRDRDGGAYYDAMWRAALDAKAVYVGISTYNEWGEGTQIEAAVPRWIDVERLAPAGAALPRDLRARLGLSDAYSNYAPQPPDAYMMKTLAYSAQLADAVGFTAVADDLRALADAHDRKRERAARDGEAAIHSLPDWQPATVQVDAAGGVAA